MTITETTPRTGHQVGRQFILAGNATFTLVGRASRFTFKVQQAEDNPQRFFVSAMTGSDNEASFTYVGMLNPTDGTVRLTKGSRLREDTPAVRAIRWALPFVFQGARMPDAFAIFHEGRCGRCGRKLTVPESIVSGFGPECAGKVGAAAPSTSFFDSEL